MGITAKTKGKIFGCGTCGGGIGFGPFLSGSTPVVFREKLYSFIDPALLRDFSFVSCTDDSIAQKPLRKGVLCGFLFQSASCVVLFAVSLPQNDKFRCAARRFSGLFSGYGTFFCLYNATTIFNHKTLNYVTLDNHLFNRCYHRRNFWLWWYCSRCCRYCKNFVLHFLGAVYPEPFVWPQNNRRIRNKEAIAHCCLVFDEKRHV